MATETTNYKLVKPDVEEFYDVMVPNGNMDKVDAALKALADALGGIDVATLAQSITNVDQRVTTHLAEDASIIKKGHVQLSDSTNSDSIALAATANAVKKVNDIAVAKYTKPAVGIPKTDMASDVQTSLGKADTALQSVAPASVTQAGIVQLTSAVNSDSETLGATAKAVKTAYDRAEEAFQAGNNVKQNVVGELLQINPSLPINPNSSWSEVITALQSGSIGGVKSIQRGTATLPIGKTDLDIPIDTIDMSKAIITISYRSTTRDNSNNYFDVFDVAAQITSNTNIHISRSRGNYQIIEVHWTVTEFLNVKSVQRGSVSTVYTATSTVIPINPVNLNKSLLFFTAEQNTGNNYIFDHLIKGEFVDSSSLKFSNGEAAKTYEWQVLEFK